MRIIQAEDITQEVARLYVHANIHLNPDVRNALYAEVIYKLTVS